MPDVVLAAWRSPPTCALVAPVIPDGCRDLIVVDEPGARPHWFVSDLDNQTRMVSVAAGVTLNGLRLRPGAQLNEQALLKALERKEPDLGYAQACLSDLTVVSTNVVEALDCLASGIKTVAIAAGDLGVSPRTLQRLLIETTGRAPSFWLMLARVRRAARDTIATPSLGDVAYAHGFADQAHMSREFRRWLGVSPGRLKANTAVAAHLFEPGYA